MDKNVEILNVITDKVLLLKIKPETVIERGGTIYAAARGWWHVEIERVRRVDYILAVVKGVVEGVFEDAEWSLCEDRPGRKEFKARQTDNPKFFGKRISDDLLLKTQNPVRYLNTSISWSNARNRLGTSKKSLIVTLRNPVKCELSLWQLLG